MKKAIIIGATSGIGQEVARILVQQGWRIGIAGRREDVLLHMQQNVFTSACNAYAPALLYKYAGHFLSDA